MGTYGETLGRAALPTTNFQATGDKTTFTCDQCVAPSVAVVVIGEGSSALSLEFCQHHLAQHTEKLADGGHHVHSHN